MKKLIGYFAVGAVCTFIGGLLGWTAHKKTTEVQFEEISPDEQAEQIANDIYEEKPQKEIRRPLDIQQAIDSTFGVYPSVPDAPNAPTPVQLDTQKEQYFKKWKESEKYDTRTKEDPENPVISEEEPYDPDSGLDPDFMNELNQENQAPARRRIAKDIEEGTIEDWNHWLGVPDGDWEPVEVFWFDEDNVVADDKGEAVENQRTYLGFDPEKIFNEVDEDTTGDPDIRVVFNTHQGAIFQIVRKHTSFERKRGMEEFGDDDDSPYNEREWIQSRMG